MDSYSNHPDHSGLQRRPEDDGLQPIPMYSPQQKLHEAPGSQQPYEQQYQQPYEQPYQQFPAQTEKKPTRTICGLGARTFWLVLALCLITIAAIVGGTVGGVVGSQKSAANVVTTTLSPTSTSSTISILQSGSATLTGTPTRTTATHTGVVALPSASSTAVRAGCPLSSGTNWTSASGFNTFQIYCGNDFPGNDLIGGAYLTLDNFDACLNYCAGLNDQRNFTLCYGVAYNWEETPGYCYFKNPGGSQLTSTKVNSLNIDSGILLQ